jgi:S-adenosylmethionine:tRNA ribosyltransferase-isomerase|tara:strand:- start:4759 stop:5784 length:1026 start_codon:yes stop_codon:yes gene_type:complete
MKMIEFDYDLPEHAIAQFPAEPRDSARLLVDQGSHIAPLHAHVKDLADYLEPGDLLVLNETKVIPARIPLVKETGGLAEVLLLEPHGDTWEAMVKPGRRLKAGTKLRSPRDPALIVEVGEETSRGRRLVSIIHDGKKISGLNEISALDKAGEMPLPPYIKNYEGSSKERYQTVYAKKLGSAAAPTAGLHFTDELIENISLKGIEIATVELTIGIDTFQPITVSDSADHVMHSESYNVPEATWHACQSAKRVVAVGTTTVRSLESAARGNLSGRTDLFLSRGEKFQIVDCIFTNFHLPKSSLLLMIDSFVGERWQHLYSEALAEGYRFLSYGDAMFLQKAAD